MCQRLVCQKSSLYDHLHVKFNDLKLKNEIFVRIDMKHSYFTNYLFAINFFLLLKQLFARNYSCLCIIFVLVV